MKMVVVRDQVGRCLRAGCGACVAVVVVQVQFTAMGRREVMAWTWRGSGQGRSNRWQRQRNAGRLVRTNEDDAKT